MTTSNPSEVVFCATHPGTVTYLRCAQCDLPICPRCLVIAPVGAKCRNCARARLQPAFVMRPVDVALALAASLVGGTLLGLAASLLTHFVRFLSALMILFPLLCGLALSRLMRRLVPRKHGLPIKVAVGVGVVIAFFVLSLGDFILLGPLDLIQSAMIPLLVRNVLFSFIFNPFAILFLALGVYVGVTQTD